MPTLEGKALLRRIAETPSFHVEQMDAHGAMQAVQGEREVAEMLAEQLADCGCRFREVMEVAPKRANVIAVKGGGPNVVYFTGHIDTVPGILPYEEHGDRIYGRVWDMPAGNVAMIDAFRRIDPPPDQANVLGLFADEEGNSAGVLDFLKQLRERVLDIGDPSWIFSPEINTLQRQASDTFLVTLGRMGHLKASLKTSVPEQHGASRAPGAMDLLDDLRFALKQCIEMSIRPRELPTRLMWDGSTLPEGPLGFVGDKMNTIQPSTNEDPRMLSMPSEAQANLGVLFGPSGDLDSLFAKMSERVRSRLEEIARIFNRPELPMHSALAFVPPPHHREEHDAYIGDLEARPHVTHYEPYLVDYRAHESTLRGMRDLLIHNPHGSYQMALATDASTSDMNLLTRAFPEAFCAEIGAHGFRAHNQYESIWEPTLKPLTAFYEGLMAGRYRENS